MQQFEILDELFHADSFIFMLIGIITALAFSLKIPKFKTLYAVIITLGVALLCEFLLKELDSYFTEILLIFIGTVSIGAAIGFISSDIIKGIQKKINRQK